MDNCVDMILTYTGYMAMDWLYCHDTVRAEGVVCSFYVVFFQALGKCVRSTDLDGFIRLLRKEFYETTKAEVNTSCVSAPSSIRPRVKAAAVVPKRQNVAVSELTVLFLFASSPLNCHLGSVIC